MADWTTISSLATAGGTLILAVATFSSVRSANRAARTAERALQVGLRPVLMPSRLDDPPEKLRWLEGRWVTVPGGRAYVEETDGIIYLAMSLRNVGSGIAVIQGWRASGERPALERPRPDPSEFRNQSRDLYIPSGGSSFWQGALRDQDEERYEEVHAAVIAGDMLVINLLYTDHEGGQRTISEFLLTARADGSPEWMNSVIRHWNLDRADPR